MMKQKLHLLMLALSLASVVTGCSTAAVAETQVAEEIADEDFLPRPRFGKAQARPLGRVMISWENIESAEGYEIQMADSESFNNILKKWTIRGCFLELPLEHGSVLWFRIRAFNRETSSRWSAVLKVEEKSL